jgi:hypothetical protein
VSKARSARKADNLTAIYDMIVYKNMEASTSHYGMGLHGHRDSFIQFTALIMQQPSIRKSWY